MKKSTIKTIQDFESILDSGVDIYIENGDCTEIIKKNTLKYEGVSTGFKLAIMMMKDLPFEIGYRYKEAKIKKKGKIIMYSVKLLKPLLYLIFEFYPIGMFIGGVVFGATFFGK